jgi:hypothetical protein
MHFVLDYESLSLAQVFFLFTSADHINVTIEELRFRGSNIPCYLPKRSLIDHCPIEARPLVVSEYSRKRCITSVSCVHEVLNQV